MHISPQNVFYKIKPRPANSNWIRIPKYGLKFLPFDKAPGDFIAEHTQLKSLQDQRADDSPYSGWWHLSPCNYRQLRKPKSNIHYSRQSLRTTAQTSGRHGPGGVSSSAITIALPLVITVFIFTTPSSIHALHILSLISSSGQPSGV